MKDFVEKLAQWRVRYRAHLTRAGVIGPATALLVARFDVVDDFG